MVIVNDNDLRQKACESDGRNESLSIMQCIGQIESDYTYDTHEFRTKTVGTATVFHVAVNGETFAVTAAHNVRLLVWECTECGKYMHVHKKKQHGKCRIDHLKKTFIKPTNVRFVKRCNELKEFGNIDKIYEIDNIMIDEYNYKLYPTPTAGYDLCVVKFAHKTQDYKNLVKNIRIENGKNAISEIKQFNIWGYPINKINKQGQQDGLYGMKSPKNATYSFPIDKKTNRMYFSQSAVDVSSGQAGSSIWVTKKEKHRMGWSEKTVFVLCGVHTGGSARKRYNAGVLFDDNLITQINNFKENKSVYFAPLEGSQQDQKEDQTTEDQNTEDQKEEQRTDDAKENPVTVRYNTNIINQLIKDGIGNYNHCLAASILVEDYNDINAVRNKVREIKNSIVVEETVKEVDNDTKEAIEDNVYLVGNNESYIQRLIKVMTNYQLQQPLPSLHNYIERINITECLDDFHYLLHDKNQKESHTKIVSSLKNCDAYKCIIFQRNYRDRIECSDKKRIYKLYYENAQHDYNNTFISNVQILDKIHCYYQHGYSIQNESLIKNKKENQNREMPNLLKNRLSQKYNQLYFNHSEKMYFFGCEFHYNLKEEQKIDNDYKVIITPKHKTLKDELISNEVSVITIEQFMNENTNAKLHYNCKYRKKYYPQLLISHILVLMIYSNYDVLQYEFSKTYRDQNGFKHCNFCHFGKLLKQSVIDFGTEICNSNIKKFYHGINQKLVLPEFVGLNGRGIKIYCPLSTSPSIEVAANFTNQMNGLIIEFGGNRSKAKYFSVSWLSDYANEQEHLFVQNKNEIIVNNIIECKSGVEYNSILEALRNIEAALIDNYYRNDSNIDVLSIKLIEHVLSQRLPNDKWQPFKSLSKYGLALVLIHFENKKSLSINYSVLENNYPKLFKLFCLTKKNDKKYEWINKDVLYSLFPNVKHIEIKNINLCSDVMYEILSYHRQNHVWNWNTMRIEANDDSDLSVNKAEVQFGNLFKESNMKIRNIDWIENSLLIE